MLDRSTDQNQPGTTPCRPVRSTVMVAGRTTIVFLVTVALMWAVHPITGFAASPGTIAPDFQPAAPNVNLGSCMGFLERPGCGAPGRGGPLQGVLFVALAGGLGFIAWRIRVGMRGRTATPPQPNVADASPDDSTPG